VDKSGKPFQVRAWAGEEVSKMSSQWVDFSALKGSVDIEPVLAHYRVRLKRVRKDYLRGLCPLPTHGSEQSRESFGVDTSRNVWACHLASCCQARNGKVGGNILDMVVYGDLLDSRGGPAAERLERHVEGNRLCPASPPPVAPARLAMLQNDLPAELAVRVTDASGRTISEPASDLVKGWRRFLIQRRLQRAANLLRAAFRRSVPGFHDLARSLRSHFGKDPWIGTVHKARDRELELIPGA
jgi:hypothetical protein